QVPARVLVRVRHPDRPAEPEVARLVPRQPEGKLLRAGGVRARGPQGARDRGRLRVDLRRGAAVVDARGQTQGPARGLRPGPARGSGPVAHPPIVTVFVIGARAALRPARTAATLCASRSARWAARIASTVCGVTSSKLAGRSGSFSRRRTST